MSRAVFITSIIVILLLVVAAAVVPSIMYYSNTCNDNCKNTAKNVAIITAPVCGLVLAITAIVYVINEAGWAQRQSCYSGPE